MQKKFKIGIVGYGNLGKGAEMAIRQNEDMELAGIFTRRNPAGVDTTSPVFSYSRLEEFTGKIDVMILCGGSAKDLPEQVLFVARHFHTVDSFDTHAKISDYFNKTDAVSRAHNKLSLISTGWDPGIFSMVRVLGESLLPKGETYTFWGKGLSQGHSDAVRRIPGVKNAVQYTIPVEAALKKVRNGDHPVLSTAEKHQRVCYVVADKGAVLSDIEHSIRNMPHYFEEYDTTIHFINEEQLLADHSGMPHGGLVFRSGQTGIASKQKMEFSLNLESNPEFTASVLVAYARAIAKMAGEGQTGARTVFDIPLGYLSPKSAEELRRDYL